MTVPDWGLTPGQVLGHYLVQGPIGVGGMGEVYRAKDTKLDRVVALKLLPVQVVNDREHYQRFQKEARILAALNHPGIVTLHAVEEEGAYHFLVMEFVEGRTLRQALPEGGLPLKTFFEIAIAITDALNAAHEGGIIHRDLKPENLMLTKSGRLKILDFGLARSEAPTSDGSTLALTKQGFIMGTVPYLSPEQAQGKQVDPQSDIFSLGIVLHELLTGQRPFRGESAMDIISAILRDAPVSLTSLRADIPPHLVRIIRHCLEKNPRDRIQSMLELHNQLKALQRELEEERILSASPRTGTPSRTAPGIRWSLGPSLSKVRNKASLHWLLVGVMVFNLVETLSETWLREHFGLGVDLGDRLAQAARALEGELNFGLHDMANVIAVYGFSISYFFLFPLLTLLIAWQLARREDAAYRTLAHAVTITYGISLPFFLFFPVPERWFYPESGAILLSDLWTSKLIEAFRPISGIDNCFPSFHTCLTTVLVLAAFRFGLKYRLAVLFIGLTILLSTFALGIHWLTDITAGLATGFLGFFLALRLERQVSTVQSFAQATAELG